MSITTSLQNYLDEHKRIGNWGWVGQVYYLRRLSKEGAVLQLSYQFINTGPRSAHFFYTKRYFLATSTTEDPVSSAGGVLFTKTVSNMLNMRLI